MEKHAFILDLIKDFKIGAEIGVLKGDLSKKILSGWGGKLYMIDAWRYIDGLLDFNNPDNNGHLNNMAHTFMAVYNFGPRACIIRDLSVSVATLFADKTLDFVYIDAGHDIKSVTQDLKAWYPKVKEGGILIGDDYFDGLFHLEGLADSTTLVEVKSAVDDFAKTIDKKVNFSDTTHPSLSGKPGETLLKQWWICK